MRKLLYLPIIHSSADLGSMAPALEQDSIARCGPERWQRHKRTVAQFWEAASRYFLPLAGPHLKLYQDGIAAGGELGRRIVQQAAGRGSPNHQLLVNLMAAGAEVRATEDPGLLAQEYENLFRQAAGEEAPHPQLLTGERDRFIARAINGTLRQGEVGALFLGSFHDVLPYLDRDIAVGVVKDRELVNAYLALLFSKGEEAQFQRLLGELTTFPPPPPWAISPALD